MEVGYAEQDLDSKLSHTDQVMWRVQDESRNHSFKIRLSSCMGLL